MRAARRPSDLPIQVSIDHPCDGPTRCGRDAGITRTTHPGCKLFDDLGGVGFAADHSFDNGTFYPGSWDFTTSSSMNQVRYCGNGLAFEGLCYQEYNSPTWSSVFQEFADRGTAAPNSMYMCARIRSSWPSAPVNARLSIWDMETFVGVHGPHVLPAGDATWHLACSPTASGIGDGNVRVEIYNETANYNLSVDDIQVWS